MFLMTGEDDLPRELLDAPRERLLMEIRLLRDEAHHRRVAELSNKLRDVETQLLHSRDFAIGAAAELGEHRARLAEAALRNKKLRNELNRVYKSLSWRIGQIILLPLRVIRKLAQGR
jgi:hypothetical protein